MTQNALLLVNLGSPASTQVEAAFPEDALRWRRRDPDFEPSGGESLTALYARCIAVVSELATAHAGQTIAIVAHGGVLDCLYRAATRIESTRSSAR